MGPARKRAGRHHRRTCTIDRGTPLAQRAPLSELPPSLRDFAKSVDAAYTVSIRAQYP